MAEIGTCVIILNQFNQILLGKRLNSYRAGMYGLPGGRLEEKEKLMVCASREVEEETSIKTKSLEYVGVIKEAQEKGDFVHFVFSCSNFDGIPMLTEPDKCEGWNWYSLDKLPENILPGHKAGIELYQNSSLDRYKDLS